MPTFQVIPVAALAQSSFSRQMRGAEHGDLGVSLIFVGAAPGQGPSLHRHDYPEIFVVLEGTATFTDGERSQEVCAGEVVVVPAGQPHGFRNTGPGALRQVDIHVANAFATTWL